MADAKKADKPKAPQGGKAPQGAKQPKQGKRGKVLRVLRADERVLVEKVNMVKKHQRPTQKLRQGGIIEREGALALSNVLPICARCDKPSRTGMKALADGRKIRICKRCGEAIDKG